MGITRRVLLLSVALALAVPAGAQAQARGPAVPAAPSGRPADFDAVVRPFLDENCHQCHKGNRAKGSLDLERRAVAGAVAREPDLWDAVLLKVRTGEMPPPDEPRPDPAEKATVEHWLAQALERADRASSPDPGRVTARRLNRVEYNNTIRDLLGVDARPADDFPQDDSGYGFDNIADVLSLPPVLMERYMAAAERLARLAIFGPPPAKPTLTRRTPVSRNVVESPDVPPGYDSTGLSLVNALHVTHRVATAGEFVVHVVAGGVRPRGSEPISVALWVDGRQVGSAVLSPDGRASFVDDRQDYTGASHEFRVRLGGGDHWLAGAVPRLYEGLPASYGGPNPSQLPGPPPLEFTPPAGASPERVARLRRAFEERQKERAPANSARVSALEILGPYPVPGPPPASRARVVSCGHPAGRHQASCATRVVSDLARRAFRRPVSAADVRRLLALKEAAERRGASFEEGLAVALQAMLVAPDFLFRIDRPLAGPGPHPIDAHALASRLSYFLWSSMPDEELMRAADAGTLRRPEVVATQVRRMLQDPKAFALVEHFAGQWLQFRALESAAPDRERFPAFDDYLRLSMRRETELFVESIVREDRSLLDFIDAPYTFVNEKLARHYGLPGVSGPEFRRVALDDGVRAGVITHASVLTVSSYATRTSPVLRGKWILENILAAPPPAPPPGAPNLDETGVTSAASLRQQLEAHRANPTCASCHRRMDPLGFGLENFDAIGAWRTADGTQSIDASGTLPDGRTFTGPGELRTILRAEPEAFARALAAKLLTYALGRGLEAGDRATVRTIARRLADRGYRFSELVVEIVNSPAFRMRRPESAS